MDTNVLKAQLYKILQEKCCSTRYTDFQRATGLNASQVYGIKNGNPSMSLESAINVASKLGVKITVTIE